MASTGIFQVDSFVADLLGLLFIADLLFIKGGRLKGRVRLCDCKGSSIKTN